MASRKPTPRQHRSRGHSASFSDSHDTGQASALVSPSHSSTPGKQNIKRRGTRPAGSNPAQQSDDVQSNDVLVYVHKVQPTDTLARVVLAYDIDASILRKANRLWPNDIIQMRSILYLPVSECLVKGVRTRSTISSPSIGDLQMSEQTVPVSEGHHSFVTIDAIGIVELIRLPQRQLNYFPSSTLHMHGSFSSSSLITTPEAPDEGGDGGDLGQIVGNLTQDSFDGLEVVGAAIESFVKKLTTGAKDSWFNKTTGDLIELTSRLGNQSSLRNHDNPSATIITPSLEASSPAAASGNNISKPRPSSNTSRVRRRPRDQDNYDNTNSH